MPDKRKRIITSIAAVLLLVLITIGVTYAVFTYTKLGSTENTVTAGTLKFVYTENEEVGNGISLTNAFPVSDAIGKSYSTENYVFDFKIEGTNTSNEIIPYEVTLRKKNDSTLVENAVKVYLTDMTEEADSEILKPTLYSDLTQTLIDVGDETEKTIYTGSVSGGKDNYIKNFRLRMWVDETADFSNEQLNNKTFTATVNVYSNVALVSEEEISLRANTEISSLTTKGTQFTAVTGESYQYETTLPEGTTETTITVETENPNATVTIEKVDSLSYDDNSNIKRMSVSKTIPLTLGENFVKVTIESEDKSVTTSYILRILVKNIVDGDSIIHQLSDNSLETGYYTLEVQDETYPVHLYVLDGNQVWSENQVFGDEGDVATATEDAKNMVVVKVNGNLTIEENVTVTAYSSTYGGPKGLTLYVDGTLTNNGTISMTGKGAKAEGQNVHLWKNEDGTYETVPAVGASGGTGTTSGGDKGVNGNKGDNGENRATAGGGGGGNSYSSYNSKNTLGGAGSAGTSYSGGAGGGAGNHGWADDSNATGTTGGGCYGINQDNRCQTGVGITTGSLPADVFGIKQANLGTGGLLTVYAENIINNGTIEANGISPAKYNDSTMGSFAYGGASGGGSVNIFCKSLTNNNLITALGGQGYTSNGRETIRRSTSGSGGNGSVTYTEIDF